MPQHRKLDAGDRPGGSFTSQLGAELGAASPAAREAVRSLYLAAVDRENRPARRAFDRWAASLDGACGQQPKLPSPAVVRLAECYGFAPLEPLPAELLFAVHTYYAVLVRLVVWQWAATLDGLHGPAEESSRAGGGRLGDVMAAFELDRTGKGQPASLVFRGDLFSWYLAAWSEPLARLLRRAADLLAGWRPDVAAAVPVGCDDLLSDLYRAVFPRPVRHALGEYYTPDWLVDHVLDEVGYQGDPSRRLLDPACGSGRFLASAIRRARRWHHEQPRRRMIAPEDLCRTILANVVGFDLHPLAVLSARANYLIALGGLARHLGENELPARTCDAILRPDQPPKPSTMFDFVVGNPPWIAWDHLPPSYRRATRPLWKRYGLFSLSGSEARHGGGKKDLSMLLLYRTADRDLKDGGRLGMVITQTLFQTKGAGDGFRRFRIGPDGTPLRVLRVNDLVKVRPFADAANWTSTIVLQKGSPTVYPVPYVKWRPAAGASRRAVGPPDACRRQYEAEPIDPGRPSSPWFLRPPELDAPLARLTGPSDYQAHLGANTGGANGVYWVELIRKTSGGVLVRNVAARGKHAMEAASRTIEPDLLYPLVRWSDVRRYRARPALHLVLAQDVHMRQGIEEATMRRCYPKTLAYLEGFRGLLAKRAAYKRYQQRAAFYSMYNVGAYTAAPVKVVWRRMDRRINAAVVEAIDDPLLGRRAVVPQETCVLVAVDTPEEAHYLCGLMNSAIVNFLVASHSVPSGKGFGTPGMLDYLRLRRFDPASAEHSALALASRCAHDAAARGEDVGPIQRQIDALAAALWDLGSAAEEAVRREIEPGC